MSSHWAWSDRAIMEHDEKKPFAPENGKPLKFKKGDEVVFRNDNGILFDFTVTGHYRPDTIDCMYATGYRYLLDWDCPWMPVREESLTLRT